MKKILTILLILLLSQVCFAGRVQQAHKAVIAAKNGSSGACTPLTITLADSAGIGSGGATSLAPDLGSAPTSGTLLRLVLATATANATVGTPAGWTLVQSYASDSVAGWVWEKISDGTEQTVTISWTGTEVCSSWLGSFSGFSTPTLNVSAENEANTNSPTQSLSSGTTGALASSCSYAIATFIVEIGTNADDTTRSYSNSFTEAATYGTTSASRPSILIATKTLDATTAVETTLTTTDTGDDMYGVITVYRSGS